MSSQKRELTEGRTTYPQQNKARKHQCTRNRTISPSSAHAGKKNSSQMKAPQRKHKIKTKTKLMPVNNPLGSLGLTARETEVLTWIAQGKPNHEIGIIL